MVVRRCAGVPRRPRRSGSSAGGHHRAPDDLGHRAVPEAAARWLVRYLARHDVPDGGIVDLGCGSGVFAAAVAGRTGRPLLGIDVSPEMLALARRTAPAARFRLGSIHEVALPGCAVVTAIGEVLGYVPPRGRLPALSTTFRRVRASLRPGGLFLFDLVTGPRARLAPSRGFRTGPDWAVLAETRPSRAGSRFERHITTFREVRGTYRRSDEVHAVQIHDRRGVVEALRDAGFTVRSRKGYGRTSQLPGRTVFLARRR